MGKRKNRKSGRGKGLFILALFIILLATGTLGSFIELVAGLAFGAIGLVVGLIGGAIGLIFGLIAGIISIIFSIVPIILVILLVYFIFRQVKSRNGKKKNGHDDEF